MRRLIARSLILASAFLPAAVHAGGPVSEYRVTHLESLGGTFSRGNSINNRGWVTGYSNLEGEQSRHATLWLDGSPFDLGTLGGPNSSVAWPVKNNRGLIVGISQTAIPEPWERDGAAPSSSGRRPRPATPVSASSGKKES